MDNNLVKLLFVVKEKIFFGFKKLEDVIKNYEFYREEVQENHEKLFQEGI